MENENQDKIISNSSAKKPRPGEVIKPASQMKKEEESQKAQQKAESTPEPKPEPKPTTPPSPEQPKEKPTSKDIPEPSKVNVKKLASVIVAVAIVLGLVGGAYYVYSSGLYKSVLDLDFGILSNNQEISIEQSQQQEDQPDEAAQQESTKTLDYLEDELNKLEESVLILEDSSDLTELLNLENSQF